MRIQHLFLKKMSCLFMEGCWIATFTVFLIISGKTFRKEDSRAVVRTPESGEDAGMSVFKKGECF